MKPELKRGVLLILCALAFSLTARAFPPAPHHVIFGMVRDELGNPLADEKAELIFETAAGVKLTTHVVPKGEPGQNYSIEVPMDSGITSDVYMATAMRPTVPFKIRVKIGGVTYLPIEMSGNYAALGQPGKKTKLNLTLGVDSDGDGLPDAWERNILAALGQNGTLADITPGGDSDGDGMSNLAEYLAGTYAFDREDGFALKIKEVHGNAAKLEFMAIRGRTYTIHASSDLSTWTQTPFKVGTGSSNSVMNWFADDVSMAEVETDPPAGSKPARFFKLMIQ